jgi:hypothetical protein
VNIVDWAFGTSSAKPVTISFWVKSTVTGLYSGNICNYAETRICPFTFTVNLSNTWEYKTYTFPGDTSGTWVTDTNGGASVYIYPALGSNYYNGTAGVWGTSPNYGAGGASHANALATNGNIFAITGVQLETGTVATPFERRHFGAELALCQRYYQYQLTDARTYGNAGGYYVESYIVPAMRATPTVTTIVNGGSANISGTPTVVALDASVNLRLTYLASGTGDTYYGRSVGLSAEL